MKDGILTSKLFEYLYSGTKILGIGVTDNSLSGKIIKESDCGISFGKDVEKIKNYLIELLKTGKKDTVNPNNEILEKFPRKNHAEKLMNIIEKYMLKIKLDYDKVVDIIMTYPRVYIKWFTDLKPLLFTRLLSKY
jgi:hypothetical protein